MKRDFGIVTTLGVKEVAWAWTKHLAGKNIRPEQCFGCAPDDKTGFPGVKILTGPARSEHVVGISHLDNGWVPKVESFSRKTAVPQRMSKLGLQRIIGRHLNIHPFTPIVQIAPGDQADKAKKQDKGPHDSRAEPIHQRGVKVSD
jgi:hypothetical protein